MAEKIIYCPYTDQELPESETSQEHIFPKSLGGSDEFVIPVNRDFNRKIGSEIDGQFANEFLMMIKRQEFDARGHSGKKPEPLIKKATDLETGRPLQVTMGRELKIWDVMEGKHTSPFDRKFQASFQFGVDLPLRFLAKVALATGYFVYGDLFRENVAHQELRLIMKGPLNLSQEENESIKTTVFNPYVGDLTEPQKMDFEIQKLICEIIPGGSVIFKIGKNGIGIFGGVLSTYLGYLCVPAVTKNFPRDGIHDLGHTVVVTNGKVFRESNRKLQSRVLAMLGPGTEEGPR